MECKINYYDMSHYTDEDLILNIKTLKYNKIFKDELYKRYERMIYMFANKYSNFNLLYTVEDLISEGYIVIEASIKSYNLDYDKRCSYSTFLFNMLNRKIWQIVNRRKQLKTISLDKPIDEEEKCTISDLLADPNDDYDLPEKEFWKYIHEKIEENFYVLTLKEKNVIKSLYAFDSVKMSESELAEINNCCVGNINYFKRNSFRKLMHTDLKDLWNEEFAVKK